jgi:hypothetical protein
MSEMAFQSREEQDRHQLYAEIDALRAQVAELKLEHGCTGCDSPLPILCRECYRKDMEETRQRAEQAEAKLAAVVEDLKWIAGAYAGTAAGDFAARSLAPARRENINVLDTIR